MKLPQKAAPDTAIVISVINIRKRPAVLPATGMLAGALQAQATDITPVNRIAKAQQGPHNPI